MLFNGHVVISPSVLSAHLLLLYVGVHFSFCTGCIANLGDDALLPVLTGEAHKSWLSIWVSKVGKLLYLVDSNSHMHKVLQHKNKNP